MRSTTATSCSCSSSDRIAFDHIGIASRDAEQALDALVEKLGATVVLGEEAPGFRYAMARVGDAEHGMQVEVLEPHRTDEDDFLERFLAVHGEGPHHLTFQVPRLEPQIERLRREGIKPVRTSLRWPAWQETFVVPRDGHGTVVQLAASACGYPPMGELLRSAADERVQLELPHRADGVNRAWWRGRVPRRPPSVMRRIVTTAPRPEAAEHLYRELLGGRVAARGKGWVELAWPMGARIRIERGDVAGIAAVEIDALPQPVTISGTPFVARSG